MLAYLLRTVVNIYSFLILVYIFASWIPDSRHSKWFQVIAACVDPYLNLFRRIIPRIGMFDISPVIAIFCLSIFYFVVLKMIHFCYALSLYLFS